MALSDHLTLRLDTLFWFFFPEICSFLSPEVKMKKILVSLKSIQYSMQAMFLNLEASEDVQQGSGTTAAGQKGQIPKRGAKGTELHAVSTTLGTGRGIPGHSLLWEGLAFK